MDPVEIRRRNFIAADSFPHETALGIVYDSGNYQGTLDKLLTHVDMDEFRREQEQMRAQGKYRGIGLSTYVEVCGLAPSRAVGPQGVGLQAAFWESAVVRVTPSGSAIVFSGASPHGQGLDTSFAQIAADRLGIDVQNVEVLHGDTNQGPFGWGTYGSRSLSVGGEAIARAANKVQDKAKRICAALLEASPEDIELVDGKFQVKGSPDKAMTMAEISGAAHIPPNELPADFEPGLDETSFYDPENFVFPFGAHACVVDVDIEIGQGRRGPLGRGRRLRQGDQPDADRRPGARRRHARHRPGDVRADRLRRERPARDRHVRRLRAADRGRAAVVRDRPPGDAVAGQPARRKGRRRGGHDRGVARRGQRGDRRAAPAWA